MFAAVGSVAAAGAAHHHHRGKEQPQSKTVGAGDGTP